ncbi:hypothetical protein CNY89_30320, partial [Amaricoccus sp. HAR-UPW-R2A-40]
PSALPAITVTEIRPAHLVQRVHASGMIVAVEEGAAVAPSALPAITVTEIRPAHLVQRVHASGMIVAVEE